MYAISAWRRQPPRSARVIDWSNPLTEGLLDLWDFGMPVAYGARDLVFGLDGAAGNSPTTAHRPAGQGWLLNSTDYCHVASDARTNPANDLTLLSFINLVLDDGGDSSVRAVFYNVPAQYAVSILGNGDIAFGDFEADADIKGNPGPFTGDHVIMGTLEGTAGALYFDGRAIDTGSLDRSGASNGLVTLGNKEAAAFNRPLEGVYYLAGLWNRALRANEVRYLSANPWQLFRPLRRHYLQATAGGSSALESMLAHNHFNGGMAA